MKYNFKVLLILWAQLFSFQSMANELVWSASGFKMPESIEYDSHYDRYYVSNVNGGVLQQDSNGSIGLINAAGQVLDVEWVTGLHSPKGLALYKNKLYVADVKQLVVINVDSGKIIAQYLADESIFLNGVAVSKEGGVFVSDWMDNKIYQLEDGELKVWLEGPELNSPNGLWIDKQNLYVASWGAGIKEDFTSAVTGNIKKIALTTKAIETLKQGGQWFNMDGIFPYSDGKWLISDFIKGEVVLLNEQGEIENTLKLKKGSADFHYISDKKLVIVPLMNDNQVVAYRLN